MHTPLSFPRSLILALVLMMAATPGSGAWTLEEITSPPAAVSASDLPEGANGLPDGGAAIATSGDLREAWFEDPTRRYGHGVLGDAIEAGSLAARTADGKVFRLVLPGDEVFEDITPRLADLNGDGQSEIVTIRSSVRAGAAVTLYGLEGQALRETASTPFIGRSNRWLNIAAIAPILAPGVTAIAYVETPHIGGTLRVYHLEAGRLVEKAELYGFSNHAIGSRELDLAETFDADGDGLTDLLIPDATRSALRLVGKTKTGLGEKARFPLPARVRGPLRHDGTPDAMAVIVPLEDGKTYRLVIQPEDVQTPQDAR